MNNVTFSQSPSSHQNFLQEQQRNILLQSLEDNIYEELPSEDKETIRSKLQDLEFRLDPESYVIKWKHSQVEAGECVDKYQAGESGALRYFSEQLGLIPKSIKTNDPANPNTTTEELVRYDFDIDPNWFSLN